MNQNSRYLAFSQSKIDLSNEVNYELSKDDLDEAVKLSSYTKGEKIQFNKQIDTKELTNTGRMWACALMGI